MPDDRDTPDEREAASATPPGDPPRAPVRPHVVASPHGERNDPYYWLRDDERRDPEVLAFLNAENAYKERALAPAAGLREKLYGEIIARLKPDDASVPYFKNGFWYATRFEPGKEHPILVRHRGTRDAAEEIVLDCNERAAAGRAAGRDYYQIGTLEISPSSEWAAFCEDFVGRQSWSNHDPAADAEIAGALGSRDRVAEAVPLSGEGRGDPARHPLDLALLHVYRHIGHFK